MKIRKVKTSRLIIGLFVGLIFSVFMGFTAGARGFGSRFPQLNLVAAPFLCPNGPISYTQHVTEIGSDTYWSAIWYCVDEETGAKTELDPDTVFLYAAPLYSLVFLVVLLAIVYFYWNSSIGPAKNDGLHLW